MIAREAYVGPITKSAEAMFERAERRARRLRGESASHRSSARPSIWAEIRTLGLSRSVVRQWEEAGVVAFDRRKDQRVVDPAAVDRLRAVLQLRKSGWSLKQIAALSQLGAPDANALVKALGNHEDH